MKFSMELAARIRDEIFEADERLFLSYVVGTVYIDIADQLYKIYQYYEIRNEVTQFIKECAILKHTKGNWYIEQIRVLIREQEALMDPKKYYREGGSASKSNTNLLNDFESKTTSDSSTGNVSYEFQETGSNSKSAALVRGASTQTSQKNKGIEGHWQKDLLIPVNSQVVGKKEIDLSKILSKDNKTVSSENVSYDIVPDPPKELQEVGGELYSTINVGVTGNTGTSYLSSGADSVGVTRQDGEVKSTSTTYSNTDFEMEKDYKSYVHNEATLRVLRLRHPDLFQKLWTVFMPAFKYSV